MIMNCEIIGNKIRFFRENEGLSQEKFAKIIGIGSKTLFNYEKTGIIPSDILFRIAEYFDKNPMIFLSNESQNYIKEPKNEYEINTLKSRLESLEKEVSTLQKSMVKAANLLIEKDEKIKELESQQRRPSVQSSPNG